MRHAPTGRNRTLARAETGSQAAAEPSGHRPAWIMSAGRARLIGAHVCLDELSGVLAIALQERCELLGRRRRDLEELLAGKIGKLRPAQDRDKLCVHALYDRIRGRARHHTPQKMGPPGKLPRPASEKVGTL